MDKKIAILIVCLSLICQAIPLKAGDIDTVRAQVIEWSRAWQSRDIDRYMSFYSPSFRSKGFDYQSWQKQKALVFKSSGDIQVDISDLWVFIEKKQAVVSFVQRYFNQAKLDIGEKTLILVNENDTWKIVSEEWVPLKTPVRPAQKKTAAPTFTKPDTGLQKVPQIKKGAENEDLPTSKNIVKSVKVQIENDSEKVFLSLNSFVIPRVLTLEGDRPRIVIDVMNVSFWNGRSRIPVDGKLIRQIRTYLHRDIEKLRIVLDLNPADDYMIDQTFDKTQNIYCLEVANHLKNAAHAQEQGASR